MITVSNEQLTETVAPTVEPMTLAQAKTFLRGPVYSDEDSLISTLITAAREWVEDYCQRSFVPRTYRADLANFDDCIVLPRRPIISISSVQYYNTDSPSVLTTLASSTYALQADRMVRNSGETWPAVYDRYDAVQITYLAGYDSGTSPLDATNVPKRVYAAVGLMVGDLFENREAKIVGTVHSENPTVLRLLDPLRVHL